jgi:molecular chaperone HscA
MVAMLQGTFAAMPGHLVEKIVDKGGVRLLLSGGGASLPMATGLADQAFPARTGTIRIRLTDVRPDWESSKGEDFRSIYPQLAVAVGGASPFLPEAT